MAAYLTFSLGSFKPLLYRFHYLFWFIVIKPFDALGIVSEIISGVHGLSESFTIVAIEYGKEGAFLFELSDCTVFQALVTTLFCLSRSL